MPRTSQAKRVDSTDVAIGQQKARELKSEGPAIEAMEREPIQPVDHKISPEKAKTLKFMEEEVTVFVHDTTNETDDPVPVVIINGVSQYFQRGIEQKVKRKFVARLAEARKTVYRMERYLDGNGVGQFRYIPHSGLMCQFQVRNDSAEGVAWLKKTLEAQL